MLRADECEYLRHIALFASLDEDALAQLGAVTVERRYDRGEVIVVEGDRGGALRFVRSGLVKLSTTSADGREQVLRLVPEGQTFNLIGALDGQPTAASATALDATTIYAVPRDTVSRLLADHPAVAQAALQAIAADTRDIIALAKDLALYHVSERVARLLLDQERCTCELCRHHYMTQQEMAAIVGTAREMVGRTLHEFQASGIIELRNGRVVVRDLERLRVIARERVNTRSRTRRHLPVGGHDDHHDDHHHGERSSSGKAAPAAAQHAAHNKGD
ncbi:MAG TPA: Crp/Fnr family transcriptional regulator [Ktedonobacterales bacterium]|jgi:CRP/FNR family transcriptional regulator|nr:Crp/Fnr family transcriptional regulator [Ktedonobacterales bacterium]